MIIHKHIKLIFTVKQISKLIPVFDLNTFSNKADENGRDTTLHYHRNPITATANKRIGCRQCREKISQCLLIA